MAWTAIYEAAGRGFSIAEECLGHGLGQQLHEDPSISFLDPWRVERFVPGMVVTIEPVVMEGRGSLVSAGRGGLRTRDGGRAAQFEHVVAVFAESTEVLTDVDGGASAWI